jgi:hypothetical protein
MDEPEDPAALAAVIGFSDDELVLNRAGKLSPAQNEWVQHDRRVTNVVSFIPLLVIVAFVVVIAVVVLPKISDQKGSGSSSTVPIVIGVLVLFGVVGLLSFFRLRRSMTRRASGRVSRTEGKTKTRAHVMHGNVTSSGAYGGGVRYELTIGRVRFFVPSQTVLDAFDTARQYRGYYVGKGLYATLLSVEPLGDTSR